jgi:SAM-dependent methyltransferase
MDATGWDERYRASDLVWSAGPNAFVAKAFAERSPGRALDLAAGEGRNALWLAERGFEVEAVEFSAVAIEKGRRLAEHRGVEVTFTQADLLAEPVLEPADVVIVAYLQLTEADSSTAHRLAARAVAPGGELFVIAHAPRNLTDGHGGPPSADVLPSLAHLRAAAESEGLVVDVAEEVTRELDTPDGPRTAIDVLVRAHRPDEGAGPGDDGRR